MNIEWNYYTSLKLLESDSIKQGKEKQNQEIITLGASDNLWTER